MIIAGGNLANNIGLFIQTCQAGHDVVSGIFWYNEDHTDALIDGAIKLSSAALQKLSFYPDEILGIDLEDVREHSRRLLHNLQEQPIAAFSSFDIEVTDTELTECIEDLINHPPEPIKDDEIT